jgi:spore germination protein YaaH
MITDYKKFSNKGGAAVRTKQVIVINLMDQSADHDDMVTMIYAWLRDQGYDRASVDVEEVES